MSFALVTIIGLSAAIPPALVIVWESGLRKPRQVWHHPEAGIALAFTFDAARRIWILALGTPTRPGVQWTIASGMTTGLMAVVLWARVVQLVRHRTRTRDAKKQMQRLTEDARDEVWSEGK